VAVALKVLSSHALMEIINALAPAFERATGHGFAAGYDPSNVLKRRIESGEDFDGAIMTRTALDALTVRGLIVPGGITDLGRSGIGLSVPKGARKPPLATDDDVKNALLSARSIVRSQDGASGAYFVTLIERLGIADKLRACIILAPSGRVAELVARGEAEIAVQQISELSPVVGADFADPLPPELQHYTIFCAGLAEASQMSDVARRLIDLIVTPAAAALMKTHGLEPALPM
jgi:molybdate transport system substrate-binding protein